MNEQNNAKPKTGTEEVKNQDLETAVFAGGCFWGVQATFDNIDGVISTRAGYTGGKTENPTYKQVCSGTTGHAEAIEIIFDPKIVTYRQLLDVYWNLIDPTQLNRQGPDYGEQYRSAIFYHSPEQQKTAEESKQKLEESGRYYEPIVTRIEEASTFWPAEEYHQKYLEKQGLSICH